MSDAKRMRRSLGAALMAGMAGSAMAQGGVADYERAAKMLADRATPLVDGAVRYVTWLDDGSVAYALHDARGDHYLRFALSAGKAVPAFDAGKLAEAIRKNDPKGKPVDAAKLPVTALKRGADGGLVITARGDDYRCDDKRCTALEKKKKGEPGAPSPDGKSEVFIRSWNLWLRDVASGKETQLTTDGATDYGYATDNPGWKHSDKAIVVWSPDSKKIATFRQDQRKTSTMTLVGTNVGAPKV